ncbi:MAG: hypothetical protein JXQ29_04935 [Planctomycetes bacterium]|nr:hypothetical protein [Planctomycetota bacterium]
MRVHALWLILLLVGGISLAAGEVYHPDSNPASGNLSKLPWVNTEVRYQTLVPDTVLGGKPLLVTELAFATGAAGIFSATQCEITFAHLPVASSFSGTFATNLQKDATVMFSGPLTWACALDQWGPLGLTGTFQYNGVDRILIEVRFHGGAGGVACRAGAMGTVAVMFASGAGSYNATQAGMAIPLYAPKMRLTHSETVLNLGGAPTPGGAVDLDLFSIRDAGLGYQLGSSFGTGPIPIDSRLLHLDLDALLVLSVGGSLPGIFENYAGALDAQGRAKARIRIPALAALKGVRIHTAFVTVRASAPSGVANLSNTALFTIQ